MDKNIHKIEILADLIRLQNEETWLMQIAPRFAELYPHCVGSLQGYKKVFDYLKDKTSKKKKFKNPEKMEFQIKFIHEEFGKDIGKENYYHHVCGLKLKPNEKDIIETPTSPDANMTYCLSFSKLEEWLGFYVEYKTWINYSAIDIVCHCLFEMTWNGFCEEDIAERNKELDDRVKELDKWKKEGTLEKHTFTLEQVKKRINKKIKALKKKNGKKNNLSKLL